jgi:hypothetical protein
VAPLLLAPGDRANVHVEARTLEVGTSLDAEAVARCPAAVRPIRLWPSARRGAFAGTFEATAEGECTIEGMVTGAPQPAIARVVVAGTHRSANATRDALDGAIAAHGGVVVAAGDETVLVERWRRASPPVHAPRDVHPLRSPYWMVLFAGCLGAEWWLRRRSGLS